MHTVAFVTAASPDTSAFGFLLQHAGLEEMLNGKGPFTLFAPSNNAINAIPQATLDQLLADPTGALTILLQYHIVLGLYTSVDLADGLELTTVQGATIRITQTGQGFQVNNANITGPDMRARNGIIHIVDGVLLSILE